MVNARKLELIKELKALKEQKNITLQEIADRTEANNEKVSLSTIKKVFSDNYNHDHDYEHVLRPIANALAPASEDDTLELKILQTRLALKEEIINQYQDRLAAKEKKHKDRETYYIDQINFFKEETKDRDEHIKNRDEHIKNLDKVIRYLTEAIDRKDRFIRERLLEESNND